MESNSINLSQKESILERGAALLEIALITPILVMTMLALVELGSAMVQYSALTQIAHEGLRLASSTPDITDTSTTNFDCGFSSNVCYGAPVFFGTSGDYAQLTPAVFRMVQLVNIEQMNLKDTMSVAVKVDKDVLSGKPADITVTISVRPTGFAYFMGTTPVTITAKGPYLFS